MTNAKLIEHESPIQAPDHVEKMNVHCLSFHSILRVSYEMTGSKTVLLIFFSFNK